MRCRCQWCCCGWCCRWCCCEAVSGGPAPCGCHVGMGTPADVRTGRRSTGASRTAFRDRGWHGVSRCGAGYGAWLAGRSASRSASRSATMARPGQGRWVVMAGLALGKGRRGDRTPCGQRLFWGRPAQVRAARRFVVAGLAGHAGAHPGAHPGAGGVDRDLVALLVSEVVTNAVVHSASGRADGTLLVCYELDRARLRVEVRDLGGPGLPRRCRHGLESRGRRGLEVVAVLASRWGVGRHPRGRVVWFELDVAGDRGGES